MYTLKFHQSVPKTIKRFPKADRERLKQCIESLGENPRPENQIVHLAKNLYRIRVGQYRIIYAIFEEELVVVACKVTRRNKSTYKDLQSLINRAISTKER